VLSCPKPAAYGPYIGDCDDADPATYPGAPEANDGRDNQCAGEPGHGLIDEITGMAGFPDRTNKAKFFWPAQAGAASYEVVRSSRPDFTTGCASTTLTDICRIDPTVPSPGQAYCFLVRALTPHA